MPGGRYRLACFVQVRQRNCEVRVSRAKGLPGSSGGREGAAFELAVLDSTTAAVRRRLVPRPLQKQRLVRVKHARKHATAANRCWRGWYCHAGDLSTFICRRLDV